ncbi:antirestriction protein ArdA [Agrobacterium pusense]|uniref:antirestriction protein ArdA n=1 Tax=Agrobacterium pusense TaxID=648995 RepID=UPI00384DDEE3
MRFYAACLASYNNGVLHGRWIDASSDADEMQEEVSAMLRESRFPNVMVECVECDASGRLQGPAPGLKWYCPKCQGKGQVPSAEEWAIHDYDGLPSSLGEYPGLDKIAEFVELCEEHDMTGEDMAAIVSHFGSVEYAKEELENNFVGVHESFRAYAEELADEMLSAHDIKADHPLSQYFDYEAYARDLTHEASAVELDQGVAVFCA